VTTSSAQTTYSISFDNTSTTTGFVAQDISTVVSGITIPSSSYTYSIGSGTSSTISITDLTSEYAVDWGNVEWANCFPDWDRIQKMCEEYPGLKIAFEKFKTTYNLVKDDYDTPKDKRKTP